MALPLTKHDELVPPSESRVSEFQRVGEFRHKIELAMGWFAAVLSGACIHSMCLLFIMPIPVLMMSYPLIITSVDEDFGSLLTVVLVFVAGGLTFCASLPAGRFWLRALPPYVTGKWRKGVVVYLVFFAVSSIVGFVTYLFSGEDGNPQLNPASFQATMSPVLHTLNTWLPLFYGLGFTIPLAVRHLWPQRFLKLPFVLFLRRFSTFPDRTVQNVLLKCSPSGKPVAFLTPTGSKMGDWNPFRVGFSGIKFWCPICSMPAILRSTNEDWQAAAQMMIKNAQSIVLDISEGSGAIQSEITMINEGNRWQDVLLLVSEDKAATEEATIQQFTAQGATVISYRKSWWRAIPRLVVGIFLACALVGVAFIVFPMLLTWFGSFIVSGTSLTAGQAPPVSFMRSGGFGGFFSWYQLVIGFVVFPWVYGIFFVRPALNKRAVKDLSKRLRRASSAA